MPSYSIIENFEVHKNNRFLEIAEALKPELLHKEIKAEKEIMVGKDRQMRTVITEEHPIESRSAWSLCSTRAGTRLRASPRRGCPRTRAGFGWCRLRRACRAGRCSTRRDARCAAWERGRTWCRGAQPYDRPDRKSVV